LGVGMGLLEGWRGDRCSRSGDFAHYSPFWRV
jgi:hypothetical protein